MIERPKVYVVTVTYGDRFRYLEQVVEAALANGADKIVIVDNASAAESRQAIAELAVRLGDTLTLLRFEENLGSAGGYKAGLQHVLNDPNVSGRDQVWLLDDDNVPETDVLRQLRTTLQNFETTYSDDRIALLCLREDRHFHYQIVHGAPPEKVLPRPSSLVGFHICDIFTKMRKHLGSRDTTPNKRIDDPVALPYAPYGGFFTRAASLREIGLPDERFYLYSDDTEYTLRFTTGTGKIFLVPRCLVRDAERSWDTATEGTVFSRLLSAASDLRVYYTLRNNTYLSRHVRENNSLVFALNKTVFLLALYALSLYQRKPQRFRLIRRAIRDGERKILGKHPEFN